MSLEDSCFNVTINKSAFLGYDHNHTNLKSFFMNLIENLTPIKYTCFDLTLNNICDTTHRVCIYMYMEASLVKCR